MSFLPEIIQPYDALRRGFPEDSLRPVFLFGCAWRCGSTLLQRLISSSGEVFIWGENQAMTDHLLKIHLEISQWSSLIEKQNRNYKERSLKAWIANLNPDFPHGLVTAASAYLLYYYHFETIKLGYRRWGFKEVRHDSSHAKFLLKCFPNAQIIFIIRHLKDVLASNAANSWYSSLGSAKGVTQTWMQNVSSFVNVDDSRVLLVKYEDLVANPKIICKEIKKHLVLETNLDISLMNDRVRAANSPPCLNKEEREILQDSTVVELLNLLGYSN